jgi:hypothetical protein
MSGFRCTQWYDHQPPVSGLLRQVSRDKCANHSSNDDDNRRIVNGDPLEQ